MIGEKIGEVKGKRLVRRVISVDPPTAEVSFEDSGKMLGVAVNGMGTYTSVVRADGSLFGHGQGLSTTEDGEAATWTGTGLGHFGPGGSVSYRGMLFFRLNGKETGAPEQRLRRFRIRSGCQRRHRVKDVGVEVGRFSNYSEAFRVFFKVAFS